MKEYMKKMISLLLALRLCTGILALPAAAVEAEKDTSVPITVDIVDPSGAVIGSQTTTTVTSTTTTGATTSTTTDTSWDAAITPPAVSTGTPDNGSTTSTVITVQGSETKTDNVTSTGSGTTDYSGSTSGSENTSIVSITVTTNTEENVLHSDVTDPTAPQDPPVEDWPVQWEEIWEDQGATSTGEGSWTADPDSDQNVTQPDSAYEKVANTETTPIETRPVELEKVEGIDREKLNNLNPLDDKNEIDSDTENGDIDQAELVMSTKNLNYTPLDGQKPTYEDGQMLEDGSVITFVYDKDNKPVGYFQSTSAEDTLYIGLEEILKGGYINSKNVTPYYDKKGDLKGYYITTKTPRENQTSPIKPDPDTVETTVDPESYGEIITTHVFPEGYEVPKPGAFQNELTGEAGERTIEEITEIQDGKQVVVGYTITEVYVSTEPVSNGESVTIPLDPEITVTYTMPPEPVVPEPVTKDGLTTTVTVEKIMEKGKHVGYTTITTVTDASGKQVSQYQESIYRTEHSTTKHTEETPNTETKTPTSQIITRTVVKKVMGLQQDQEFTQTSTGTASNVHYQDVTQDLYQLVETDNGMYFLYKGTLYAVLDSSEEPTVSVIDTGTLTKEYASGSDENDLRQEGNMEISQEHVHVIDSRYTDETEYDSDITTKNDQWAYVGSGMYSDFTVKEANNGPGHATRMFKIAQKKENGEIEYRYVYCAELGEGLTNGGNYGQHNYKDSAKGWYEAAASNIEELRSVALNGYWGTESGIGSIEAVKDLMKRNLEWINQGRNDDDKLTANDIDALTPGMAIAATQVAIWNYANDKTDQAFDSNFVYLDDGLMADYIEWKELSNGDYLGSGPFVLNDIINGNSQLDEEFLQSEGKEGYTVLEEVKSTVKTIVALRDLLIDLAEDDTGKGKAQQITASSITQAGFILHDKVSGDAGAAVANANAANAQKYNTDVVFKLDVSTSSLNGDLVVKVVVDGKTVGGGRLAGDDSSGLFQNFGYGKIYPDENGVYTIHDVELAEGVKVDLKLEGTQHLDDGVYVFENNTENNHQDFIGLSKLEKGVDIAITMRFDVVEADPQFQHTQTKWTESKTDTDAFTKTDTCYQTKNGIATTEYETINTKTYGTTVTVRTLVSTTKAHREWVSQYYYQVAGGQEADSGHFSDGAMAKAAKTGDITLALAVVSLFSAGGLVLLNRKKKV